MAMQNLKQVATIIIWSRVLEGQRQLREHGNPFAQREVPGIEGEGVGVGEIGAPVRKKITLSTRLANVLYPTGEDIIAGDIHINVGVFHDHGEPSGALEVGVHVKPNILLTSLQA